MEVVFRMTGKQHGHLHRHLYPGDGNEAVAFVLCGRRRGDVRHVLVAHKIECIPYHECIRTPMSVTWPAERVLPLLAEAADKGLAVVKMHSHPRGFGSFSGVDDQADGEFLPFADGWAEDARPHIAAIMLPSGQIFGRYLSEDHTFSRVDLCTVVGDDLLFWYASEVGSPDLLVDYHDKNAQLFGRGTVNRLRRLTAAVIGCSGTGSIVIEQLVRLSVGRILLVDPDVVLMKNLNRIVNSTAKDADTQVPKVLMLADAIDRMGLGTQVVALHGNIADAGIIRAVAQCDIVFGCMDGVEGRHLCNRLASFYLLPYVDVGVKLLADGEGGIDQVCGAVHYIQPDGSSLLSRGVYTLEEVRSESLRRTDPITYEQRVKEQYIKGVQEERPAVISINMQFASMAVNEFLARIHPYRSDGNDEYAVQRMSLTDGYTIREHDGEPCNIMARHAGRGDVDPLLDMPALSD